MQILFLNGSYELSVEDWPHVPRVGEKVQIDQGTEVVTFYVRAVTWKKDFVRVHVTRERS